MRKVFVFGVALVGLTLAGSFASAQERMFSVTMAESKWNTLGRIISTVNKPSNWTLEETYPIFTDITNQIGGALNQDNASRQQQSKELEELKAEVARLKDELNKAKEPQP